jgi:ribonucleoside-diphosphate reductase alpha chain
MAPWSSSEIPKAWSQLATNVVVSKYFRGQIGTLEREYSVKQLIGRVSDRILEWGKMGSYFASDADAEAFHDELRYILLHQLAAFNSPVWFNLGWAGRRQAVSACYINEVDDTMESILDLYKTEGMLFKDGSGSGLNLSTLRSSKEPLEAGGRSSGPISFMKGLDASAGSIKSGGSTRRAACMRVLDIDHPDIKDFIDCKKDAEKKAHALIDAGYSGAFNVVNGAYDTVPFQNANHSVRVTDAFMQAVEADGLWDTKFRTTGKTSDTVRARDLMRGIAEGTWVCGDPGMQYDTIINDWHTCANTDRIYASNPCVTGDTLVATSEGWQRIDSLVGQSARIIGADGQPHFVDQIFPTGHKPVFKLRTRAGFEVMVTGNHQVLTTERGDVAVENLHLGEHLHLEGAGFGRRALPESLALAVGLAVGDGCLVRQTIRGREQEYVILTMSENEAPILEKVAVELNRQKDMLRAAGLSGRAEGASVVPQSTPGTARLAVGSAPVVDLFREFAVLNEGSHRKLFTPAIFDLDKPSLAAVLRGLFTADGTVANYGDKSQYVALDSTSQPLLQQVQILLLSFGIKAKLYTERRGGKLEAMLPNTARELQSYSVQEVHSLRISKASRVIFEREIGFDPASAKSARLRDMNLAFTTYKDSLIDEVVSITEAGTADVYDLTEGITHHFVANGLVVHNCSEYMFLNSTACNLSSLNLMKFRQPGTMAFDTESFEHAVRMMITAQEIVVGFAHYPTPKIEQRSHEYRTLGLGYANLGALLMAAGLPYDSDAGRSYAGAVTALMTGRAYHQSATIARDCGGPFSGFAENRDPMLRVMRKHRDHVDHINGTLIPDTLLAAARTAWDETVELGEAHGYRNAQATVLAPTGTIGFLMDCDTTGIEPDIAIVKYKSLVGGGMMKIVNQTVPEALQRLGYSEGEVEGIIKFIDANDTIEGAPDLKPEHLPIFDCAFRPMNGTRSIHYRGHIKMMAAAQPFISGAISKTVNVPNDATPEDIAETYLESWKLGVKAVAIYRDGSKRTQPLNTSKEAPAADKTGTAAPGSELTAAVPLAPPKAVRRRLPDERTGVTHKFSIGGHEGYLTVGLYPDTNQPGEIFIRMSKEGSSISGLMDSFATAISLALQYGVPLQTLVDKFIHSRFEPSGFTGNKEIPMAKSVMDYIFRYLALRFLQKEDRHNVGLLVDQDDAYSKLPTPPPAPNHDAKSGSLSNGKNGNGHKSGSDLAHLAETNTASITDHEREIYRMQSDAPPCPECGAITIRSGACYKCLSCGTSLGCS